MWDDTDSKKVKFQLFEKDKWTTLSLGHLSPPDRRAYVRSCKRDLLLFNLDWFAMSLKEKAMVGTQLEKEAYKKVSSATGKLIGKDLKSICKNLLKGKPFFDTLVLLDEDYSKHRDVILNFCSKEAK